MLRQIGRPVRLLASSLGWLGVLLLILAIAGLAGGLIWERQRRPPIPPKAQNVTSDISAGTIRQTSFRVPTPVADVRAFYQQELPKRGWRYCGTQATARCTNMINAADQQVDVYRRADDRNYTGSTIEIWPQQGAGGLTYVTLWETRSR